MAKLIEGRGDYLLLPRPWLKTDAPTIRPGSELSPKAPLYVRGDAMVGGSTIRLPYWHKVVWLGNVES
jgi:hypothetical protein